MKKKVFAAVISVSMLASMATGAYAATKLQEIKAYLNPDVKVKVDGTPTQLRDIKGNAIVPILYNDANYVPARAIADALGVAVDFDQATGTVVFGEKVDGISIAGGFNSMYHTKDPGHTVYKDKDYKEVYFDNNTGNRGSGFILNPKKEYQKLYLQIAAVGEDIETLTIKDTDKDIILKEVNVIKVSDGLMTIEVDIGGVESIYVTGNVKKDGAVFVPLTTSYFK